MCVFYVSHCKRYIARLVVAEANRIRRRGTKKPVVIDFLACLNNKHQTSFAVLIMHATTGLLYISMISASQWKYTSLSGKCTHLQVIPQQSTQSAANLPLQICKKNQWNFFCMTLVSTLAIAIMLPTLVSLPFLFSL